MIVEYGVNVSQTRLEKLGTETEADSLIVFLLQELEAAANGI